MKKKIGLIALSLVLLWTAMAPVLAIAQPFDGVVVRSQIATAPACPQENHKKPTPEYAKWGRLAMAEAKRRYPAAHIVDYSHVGRQVLSAQQAKETFKLWMRDSQREFGLIVEISFHPTSEKVTQIVCRETVR